MIIFLASLAQRFFGLFGLHVSRRTRGVQLDSALEEQLRLAGDDVRVIFEVGAADGRDAAVYTARCPNADVHAFEPLPANFKKLAQRASNEPRIKAINKAVSDTNGKAEFHVTALDDASSLLAPTTTGATFDKYTKQVGTINIETITLDNYCIDNNIDRIDLLKMDAQGAELKILNGAAKLLDKRSISVIFTEVNFVDIYVGIALYHDIAHFLEEKDYVLHSLYNFHHDQNGKLTWADAIFVPSSDELLND
jgi:FkbM family methyltransferase